MAVILLRLKRRATLSEMVLEGASLSTSVANQLGLDMVTPEEEFAARHFLFKRFVKTDVLISMTLLKPIAHAALSLEQISLMMSGVRNVIPRWQQRLPSRVQPVFLCIIVPPLKLDEVTLLMRSAFLEKSVEIVQQLVYLRLLYCWIRTRLWKL